MSHTNTSVLARYGVADLALQYPELEVPVISGNQAQGDVLLVKTTTPHRGQPIGNGVVVVRAEAGSPNTHSLHGTGFWEPNPRASVDNLVQGWLTVPADSEAFLIHTEEHSALGVGPGTYEVRTQREFAGEWQRVAD